MDIGYLHALLAAIGPVAGVSVGDAADKTTWHVDYDPGQPAPSAAQLTAVANIIAGFSPTASVNPLTLLAAAQAAGAVVTCQVTAALSGTYGTSAQDEINWIGVQAAITAAQPWPGWLRDVRGVAHACTAVQATAVLVAIMGYMTALDTWYAANAGALVPAALPSNLLTVDI